MKCFRCISFEVCHFVAARAAYGEIDASEGRRLRKRPEPKEAPPPKKASPVSINTVGYRCGSLESFFKTYGTPTLWIYCEGNTPYFSWNGSGIGKKKYSDETIIESQSKIEYFGHNRLQSKSGYQ